MDPDVGSYRTLDNGGHPFRVEVTPDKKVSVWKTIQVYDEKEIETYDETLCLSVQASKVFIGTSPLNESTKFSAGFGPEWDGNSILIQKAGDEALFEYYFVGTEVFKFKVLAPIIFFTSPVGNNSVPYPWAQDFFGNIYIFTDDNYPVLTKIVHELPVDAPIEVKEQYDPYFPYWFKERKDGSVGLSQFKYRHPATGKVYDFSWCVIPEIKFDRLTDPKLKRMREGMAPSAEDEALELGKEKWCSIIRQYGEEAGIRRLQLIENISDGRSID